MKVPLRLRLRRPHLVASSALAVLVSLIASASAVALGTPFTIATLVPGSGFNVFDAPPSVAVDAAGTAYIAWAVPDSAGNTVQYCVLPHGATACAPSGSLTPATVGPGVTAYDYGSPQVLIDRGIVSVIASPGSSSGMYPGNLADDPVQEWQAADGSANFTLVNDGQSPAYGGVGGDSGAVDVPGSNELGIFWKGGAAGSSFSTFPLLNPPQCSFETEPPCAFATLGPTSNPDQVGGYYGLSIAADTGLNPGILAVFPTVTSTGPFGCPARVDGEASGTAFAYGSGPQSATNNYNVTPGSPNSAWRVPAAHLDCQQFVGATTAGPGGFGLLRSPLSLPITNRSTISIAYLPFDQSTLSFDKPQVTVVPSPSYAQEPSLSQDNGGAMYATYELLGTGAGNGPLAFSYSDDGGATWQGPAPLDPALQDYVQNMTSSVGADGNGWATFLVGDTLKAVEFDAADAATSLFATVAAPTTSSASVTLPIRCSVVPCTVSTALTSAAQIPAPARDARAAKPIQLGTGKVTITKSGVRKLVIHLTAAGRRLLKAAVRHKHQLKVKLSEGTTLGTYTAQHTANLTLSVDAKRH